MGKLLDKLKKNKQTTNSFEEVQKISGGNLYETHMKLLAQKEIDLANIATRRLNTVVENIKATITNQLIQPYYLLELQTNYFINTIKFEMDDFDMFSKLKTMLRVAFKNGSAGIYKEKDKYMVVGIVRTETNVYGETQKAYIVPINNDTVNFQSEEEFNKLFGFEIEGDKLKNLVTFKWGSAGISAWINIWKICQIQYDLLSMIAVDKYSYVKKIEHKVNDPNAEADELEEYFDLLNPFIKVPRGVDLKNRIEMNELYKNLQPNTLVEYYKQVMGVYYGMIGRRTNNDFKKERSVTQEIGLTSDNYLTLEKDWVDEFKIFANKMDKTFGIKIEVIENQENLEDMEKDPNEFNSKELESRSQ